MDNTKFNEDLPGREELIEDLYGLKMLIDRHNKLNPDNPINNVDLDPSDVIVPNPGTTKPKGLYDLQPNGSARSYELEAFKEDCRNGVYGSTGQIWLSKVAPDFIYMLACMDLPGCTDAQKVQISQNCSFAQWKNGWNGYEAGASDLDRRATAYFAFEFSPTETWIVTSPSFLPKTAAFGQPTRTMKEGPTPSEMPYYCRFMLTRFYRDNRVSLKLEDPFATSKG